VLRIERRLLCELVRAAGRMERDAWSICPRIEWRGDL
jgi:hypothetical protein